MTLVFDIDNTLLYTKYENLTYTLLGYNEELVKVINELYYRGHTIVLNTARHWNNLKLTKLQIEQCGVLYHSLQFAKPVADFYIDDKALTPEDFLELFKNSNLLTEETKDGQ